jgi:hypothetical protein
VERHVSLNIKYSTATEVIAFTIKAVELDQRFVRQWLIDYFM